MAVAVVVYALGTPAASYAHLAYGHQLAACLLFVGVALCADAFDHADRRLAVLGGLSAGAAVAVEYGAVFAGLPLAVMFVWGLRKKTGWRPAASSLVGALVPVALLAAYHQSAFGSPFETGYHHVVNPALPRSTPSACSACRGRAERPFIPTSCPTRRACCGGRPWS